MESGCGRRLVGSGRVAAAHDGVGVPSPNLLMDGAQWGTGWDWGVYCFGPG
jgi:hypothetical protein